MLSIAFVLGLLIGILVGMSAAIWILEEPKDSVGSGKRDHEQAKSS